MRPLLFSMALPFDTDKHWYPVAAGQMYLFYLTCLLVSVTDAVVITTVIHSVCELKMLRYYFEHFDEPLKVFNLRGGRSEVYDHVKWCVLLHQKIIRSVIIESNYFLCLLTSSPSF